MTGAKGFVGRNLCESLKAIRDGKDRRPRYAPLLPLEVWEYDRGSSPGDLDAWCAGADFVFNLAGVNRPEDPAEFMEGNFGFASELLGLLERCGNKCPVMLASSAQASLEGRFAGSAYGESKLAGENLFRSYSERTGAPVLVYRFPNVYGKWCRPNYNSAVATFCCNVARGLPVRVDDPSTELELLHVDDLVAEMLAALLGEESRGPDGLCHAGPTDRATLGEIVGLLESFADQPRILAMPEIPGGSLAKKLYSTYLSYLPEDRVSFPLKMNADARGSFTEILKTASCGQFSVNVSKPGVTKGMHWHHSKWELFVVVSGRARIRERRVGSGEVVELEVSGEEMRAVHMLPGFTHEIANLSDSQDLVTLMWASEPFDPEDPDTFYEEV